MHSSTAGARPLAAALEWVVIVAFLVLVAAPLVGQLAGQSDVADIPVTEWRQAAPAPSWPASAVTLAGLPKVVEAWLNDVFGFRSALCSANQQLLAALGSTTSRFVTVGADGWLYLRRDFEANIEAESRGAVPIADGDIDAWVEQLAAQRAWLAERGAQLVVVLVPEKQSIYPEFLPEWAQTGRPTRSDKLVARVAATKAVTLVDTRPALVAAKAAQSGLLYYHSDTHWNHRGSYVAYQEVMKTVSGLYPGTRVVGSDEFTIVEDLSAAHDLMRLHNFRSALAEPATGVQLHGPSHAVSAVQLGSGSWRPVAAGAAMFDDQVTAVRTDLTDAPRVYVARDSFTNALVPFLNESFHEVVYARHQGGAAFQFVEEFAPDLVLFIVVDRVGSKPLKRWAAPVRNPSQRSWADFIAPPPFTGEGGVFSDGFEAGASSSWTRLVE